MYHSTKNLFSEEWAEGDRERERERERCPQFLIGRFFERKIPGVEKSMVNRCRQPPSTIIFISAKFKTMIVILPLRCPSVVLFFFCHFFFRFGCACLDCAPQCTHRGFFSSKNVAQSGTLYFTCGLEPPRTRIQQERGRRAFRIAASIRGLWAVFFVRKGNVIFARLGYKSFSAL